MNNLLPDRESLPLLRNSAQYICKSCGRSHPAGSLLPSDAELFYTRGNLGNGHSTQPLAVC
ncbi:MAG: hypothetical protein GY903_16500 [Fuerstiella sp.]|nr:hypothetical protein [Fuerstiella sp.]MCP4856085.1 hypothetical protein [Fuerstiella sp.]